MAIHLVPDAELQRAITTRLESSPYQQHITYLLNTVLKDVPSYLYGGMARNAVIQQVHRNSIPDSDCDIIYDNTIASLDTTCFDQKGHCTRTRLGSIRWFPEPGLSVDIIPFSNANSFRKGRRADYSLDSFLSSTDFTMNSLAFELHDTQIWEHSAIDAIRGRTIEMLYEYGDDPAPFMTRMAWYSEKLQFQVGPLARQFIQQRYRSSLDGEIQQYLAYKQKAELTKGVIATLRTIAAQQ